MMEYPCPPFELVCYPPIGASSYGKLFQKEGTRPHKIPPRFLDDLRKLYPEYSTARSITSFIRSPQPALFVRMKRSIAISYSSLQRR